MEGVAPVALQFLNGINLILIMILVSMGLVVIFGLMGVINLAHGEFFMVGAYTVVVVDHLGFSFWMGILLSPFVVGAIGYAMEISLIRFLYKRPLETLLATWGISLMFKQGIRILFGPNPQHLNTSLVGTVNLFGFPFPLYRIFIMIASILIILFTLYLFRKTSFGIQTLAVIQDSEMASSLGINTSRIFSISFTVGSGLAGLAGAIMSALITIDPSMGLNYLIRSFLVVIVGGIGSLVGNIGGGIIIGGTETAISFFTSSIVAQVMVFVIAIIVIRLRPRGVFG